MVAIGKRCMSGLKSILELILKGKTDVAVQNLLLLKTDGIAFAEKIQEILNYKEELQYSVARTEINSKRNISNCTHHLLALMEKQVKVLSDLERNTVLFFHFKSKLEKSEDELAIASQATKIFSKDSTLLRKGTIKDPKLVRTTSDDEVKDELFRKETKIRSVVEHNKLQCRAAGAVLDGFQKKLKENGGKITELKEKLGDLQREQSSMSRKVLKVKKNVVFLSNISEFWSLVHRLSNDSADNLEVARMLADKAGEKVVSASARATRMLASTLAEAMESEIIQAEKGFSHAFSFGFLCDGCNSISKTSPHVNGCMLLCKDCHGSMNVIKN